jgi:hypothetical protein
MLALEVRLVPRLLNINKYEPLDSPMAVNKNTGNTYVYYNWHSEMV